MSWNGIGERGMGQVGGGRDRWEGVGTGGRRSEQVGGGGNVRRDGNVRGGGERSIQVPCLPTS